MPRNSNINEYLSMKPLELTDVLYATFVCDVPETIENSADMEVVGKMLSEATNQYSFLATLLSYSKLQCRQNKRLAAETKDKTKYEDAVDRKDTITNVLESVKLRYKTLSRLITIKQEINAELKMSEVRAV